jgi:FkbM family methyltransferase
MIEDSLLIFGAGSHARKLAHAIKSTGRLVQAFVTTQSGNQSELDNIPIWTWKTLPETISRNSQIACAIFNRSDAYDQLASILHSHHFDRILWPWDYYPLLHQQLGWCYWLDSQPKQLSSWQQDKSYQKLISNLADQESRNIVERILAFRSGCDLGFASYTSPENQYFNPLSLAALQPDRVVSFLDVGAYDGDSLEELVRHRNVGKAVMLEPEPSNYKRLTNNLGRLSQLHSTLRPIALPLGAGAQFGSFSLCGEGEASTFNINNGTGQREARIATIVTVDDIMPVECFDFIKVDVEGHDLEALQGMVKLLRRSNAVLAVSLYHRPFDIVRLPLEVMKLLEGMSYQYFIRQHMHNSFDTVMYAIPGSVNQ